MQHELRQSSERSLKSVLSAKYPWMLRWALHFAQNDRFAAEDLVQETFIRVLNIQHTVTDLDDLEPLLYSNLRYAYLTERRRGRNRHFQSLAAAEFDTLAIGLRASRYFDQVEVQNELRSVLAFLLWRRRTAKFAGIFLLRFFHGFTPEEIASMCLITRRAVDLSLLHTRKELKAYHSNPSQLQVMPREKPPEHKPLNLAAPSHEFAAEITRIVFNSSCGTCLRTAEWEIRYRAADPRPLEVDLVAHIVSCAVCLDRIASICKIPPPSDRSMGDSTEPLRRSKRTENRRELLARICDDGEERMEEIFEHRPTGLVIALDGEVAAIRDISSPRALLRVETHALRSLEMVEVFSEQGLLMMAFPILTRPPEAPPERSVELALSCDRRLTLAVHFTCDGIVVEVIYLDPHFVADDAYETMASWDEIEGVKEPLRFAGEQPTTAAPAARPAILSWWPRSMLVWKGWRRAWVLASASIAVLCVAGLVWTSMRHSQIGRASNLLTSAVRAEKMLQTLPGGGVVHEKVTIHSAGRTLQHEIYRDISGHRHAKKRPVSPSDQQVSEQQISDQLSEDGINWDDPLSPVRFLSWHDHLPHPKDQVKVDGDGLLEITTTADSGPVLQESLTMRTSDFHPVAETIEPRNQPAVEIAELSYEVLPWGPETDQWFDPITSATTESYRPTSPSLQLPRIASPAELDDAELKADLALNALDADQNERMRINRSASAIHVSGIVQTEERKLQLEAVLHRIPHTDVAISTFQEMEAHPEASIRSVRATSSSVTQPSPLERYLLPRGKSRDEIAAVSQQLLNAAVQAEFHTKAITSLRDRYDDGSGLSSSAKQTYSELLVRHSAGLITALQQEENASHETGMMGTDPSSGLPYNLLDSGRRNVSLCTELTSGSDPSPRSAENIVPELNNSIAQMRQALTSLKQPPNN